MSVFWQCRCSLSILKFVSWHSEHSSEEQILIWLRWAARGSHVQYLFLSPHPQTVSIFFNFFLSLLYMNTYFINISQRIIPESCQKEVMYLYKPTTIPFYLLLVVKLSDHFMAKTIIFNYYWCFIKLILICLHRGLRSKYLSHF